MGTASLSANSPRNRYEEGKFVPCGDGTRRSPGGTRARNELHGRCGGWRVRDGSGHWGIEVRGVCRRLRLRRRSGAGCACPCRVFAGLSVIPRRSRSDGSPRRVGSIAVVRCDGATQGRGTISRPGGARVEWISNTAHGPGPGFPRRGASAVAMNFASSAPRGRRPGPCPLGEPR